MTKFDVFGMCNALFDVQAEVSDETLAALSLPKGSMNLVSHEEQRAILPVVRSTIVNTEAGGSGANTMLGIAQLGGTACFTSRVGQDTFGSLYRDGLNARGVQANLGIGDGDTGICLVLISPDAQRTMGTYLGMARDLQSVDIVEADIRASRYLYVTGYLWDTETQKAAVTHAMQTARDAGVKIAFNLSDPFCVGRHKTDFHHLLHDYVDVLFGNEEEATALSDTANAHDAAHTLTGLTGGIAAITRDAAGSVVAQGDTVYEIPVYPVQKIDTTGAGDMYAAGFLYGLTQDLPLPICGRIASYAAAQVVAKLGPRLEHIDLEAVERIKAGE